MKLTKAQREQVRMRFDGRCAYCGCELGQRWHADHLQPVERKLVRTETGWTTGSEMWRPENDTLDNMMPSCPPCNVYKHSMTLDGWRRTIQNLNDLLLRDSGPFRHALRFGLVTEKRQPVQFYFERLTAEAAGTGEAA